MEERIQQLRSLTYHRARQWDSVIDLTGAVSAKLQAVTGDVEIWDYKGIRASNYTADYVRQLLTYAAVFRDRTGALLVRCVLFFINEKKAHKRLLAIDVDGQCRPGALNWTQDETTNRGPQCMTPV